jgi:bifunctional non-homologous end joining protein LigD
LITLMGLFFLSRLGARSAYLDGELCGVLPDGRTAFNVIQNATDAGQGSLVFFVFDPAFDGFSSLLSSSERRKIVIAG